MKISVSVTTPVRKRSRNSQPAPVWAGNDTAATVPSTVFNVPSPPETIPRKLCAKRGAHPTNALLLVVGLAACLCVACDTRPTEPGPSAKPRPPRGDEPAKSAGKRSTAGTTAGGVHYRLAYTATGVGDGTRLPMIVAVHGLGDSPRGFSGILRSLRCSARIIFPQGYTPHGRGYSWFGFGSNRSEPEMAASAKRLATAIDDLRKRYPTNGKPIVTGFSQGGFLSLAIATRHPGSVSASLPVGSWLPASLRPSSRPTSAPPIVAFHGEADRVIPLAPTQAAVSQLKSAGFPVTLKTYPDVGHAIPPKLHAEFIAELNRQCTATK